MGLILPNKQLFLWQIIAKNKLKINNKEKVLVGSIDNLQSNWNSDFKCMRWKNITKMTVVLDFIPFMKKTLYFLDRQPFE